MANPKITFAQLQQLLLDLGFRETTVPKSHVAFDHEASGAEILLPIYRSNQIVRPHHLATVGMTLDGKDLMDREDFDALVAAAAAERSAS